MIVLDLEKEILDFKDSWAINDFLKHYDFKDGETYKIIFPEENIFETQKIFSDTYYNLRTLSLELNEFDDGYYLGNKNNPYLILFSVKDVDTINVNKDTKVIVNKAFYEKQVKTVNIYSKELLIEFQAFYFNIDLKEVNFFENDEVTIDSCAFDFCKNINIFNFSNGLFIFKSNCFGSSRINNLVLPSNGEYSIGCFKNVWCKTIYINKNITDISDFGLGFNPEIYYEGNGNDLIIQHENEETIETEQDYGFNFHRSSGSFNKTTIHSDEIRATGKNCHSNVDMKEYLSIISK